MTTSVIKEELCTKHVKVPEAKMMRAKHDMENHAFKAITLDISRDQMRIVSNVA